MDHPELDEHLGIAGCLSVSMCSESTFGKISESITQTGNDISGERSVHHLCTECLQTSILHYILQKITVLQIEKEK
ncbi:hypothetical protein AB205_0004430 [Aquarana catesbeiana]|uniref:Uncharacterized protein n=1 Tax=Aquarana catesbeiana TaxID=8400 RepID=A0A2G9S662_AQUCT|nr:hypothetical protein AB205_0004430 [Aquarana catesbeiana]